MGTGGYWRCPADSDPVYEPAGLRIGLKSESIFRQCDARIQNLERALRVRMDAAL